MGGFDEHAGIIGDWKPPSPRCRSVSEPLKDDINTSGFSFPEPKNSDGSGSERKAGLVERMAARAGYNAPTLNTNMVRETCPPPYLAISPTSLLDSPVFLSNSLVQPSPTTGKFPFAPNDNGGSSMFSDTSNKNKDKLFEGASFAFKPVPASTSNHVSKVDMSWQAFPSRGGQSENRPLPFGSGNGSVEQSRPQDEDAGDNGNNVNSNNGGASEDGYNWRKYGQKQVKGSEYPRSYYKCTHPNCPVKKKVERSHEGHITEIIYKGAHSHPKPPPPSRGAGDNVWTTINDGNPSSTQFESSDVVDGSSTFSNEEEDLATHGSVSLGYDIDGDESESKRRKVEAYATTAADVSGGSRGLREPRVVVQTTSEVDILDDGYRWRKYGQKVVKGNPNPRSYYKCTSTGCTVRKHVERASHDLKSVITTYEGKHNHDVPAARNSSHVNSQPQIHRPELPSQMGRFDYGLQQAGPPSHGYGYGTGVGQMGMPGFGGHHHNQFIGQMNGMGLMLPKGEPKVEPVSEPGLNLANANASSLYHNQMNRLPLGPHM